MNNKKSWIKLSPGNNHLVNILGSIDEKIENLESISQNLQQNLKLNFKKLYNNLACENTIQICDLIDEIISGDWGKEYSEGNYTAKVCCIRGADLPDLKNCNISNAPDRYIIDKNYLAKKLKEGDIIVELSGGSPTQSTGRSAFIPEGFNSISDNLICTNFCKAIRCKNKKMTIYCYLLFDMWYDSGLFFNYEIGTTGLKNFNLDAVLNLNIKKPTDELLQQLYDQSHILHIRIVDNALKINRLNKLKQLYLKKFFN